MFRLDLPADFLQLSHPPIVEAMIHCQARAQEHLESEKVRSILIHNIPDYSSCVLVQMGSNDASPQCSLPLPSEHWDQIVGAQREGNRKVLPLYECLGRRVNYAFLRPLPISQISCC
jgi:hypothetical protein